MSRRRFTREFKQAAVGRLEGGSPAGEVARACRVDPAILRRWQKEWDEFGIRAFGGYGTNRHVRSAPRSRSITLHLSREEFEALKIASVAAGFRSLAEFARFRLFRVTGEPSVKQAKTVLEDLAAVATKLTQRLTA